MVMLLEPGIERSSEYIPVTLSPGYARFASELINADLKIQLVARNPLVDCTACNSGEWLSVSAQKRGCV